MWDKAKGVSCMSADAGAHSSVRGEDIDDTRSHHSPGDTPDHTTLQVIHPITPPSR